MRAVSQSAKDAQQVEFQTPGRQLAERDPEQELLTINFGPHHPATHGVLRLMITLEGEVVRDCKPIIGYVHTGIEKTAEDKNYWKAIPVVERMDYLAYYFNAYAFCGAVETLLELEIPKRAQYLRVIHMELNRIKSHLVWLGTSALDLGAISMFWYCFREREAVLDLFEMSSGARMHTRYFQVGGVADDIPVGWAEKCRAFTKQMRKRADEYGALLNRIASHLIFLATGCLDLGAVSMFWYGWRERDMILDLFEQTSGQRMHTRYIQVGGVAEDVPRGWEKNLRAFIKIMPERTRQYRALLAKNEIALSRLKGVAPVDAETLLSYGVTGPLLRAAGNPWDLRKAMPYSSYEDFDFKIPVGTEGDNWDRFAIRIAEIDESVKIIEQALDGLPEGPWIADDRKVVLPPRHELATSMEALIHHFKLVTEGYRVPPGEVYYPIEGPRGEYGAFIRSDGSSKPARMHMRDPSFVNLQAFPAMAEGTYIADVIATLAMLDPILGGIDR